MTTRTAQAAEIAYIETTQATFAYRRQGPESSPPLVLANRFRGTIDHWDPEFLEVLAESRDVITFDSAGIGASTGHAPRTIEGMAEALLAFIDGLGITVVDLLGWSMGGLVAQVATLMDPARVRRLVVAGSGPGPVPGTPQQPDRVGEVAAKRINDDEDFLYLFFPDTPDARSAGLASLRRLDRRLASSGLAVDPAGVAAQHNAIGAWHVNGGVWDLLGELDLPVLVANGAHDIMIHAYQSYSMSQRLPNAKVVLYSDAGHAFLFQHSHDFGGEVVRFLAAASPYRSC
jgi:pimeloyl-ACP methyl ester carboxylesterase